MVISDSYLGAAARMLEADAETNFEKLRRLEPWLQHHFALLAKHLCSDDPDAPQRTVSARDPETGFLLFPTLTLEDARKFQARWMSRK